MQKFNFNVTYNLYIREVKRILTVVNQTIISPVVNVLIFSSMFYIVRQEGILNKAFNSNLYAIILVGMTISTIFTSSFANSSSSIISAKVIGFISHMLVPPINNVSIIIAHILASMTRTSFILCIITLISLLFLPINIKNIILALFYYISIITFSSLLGILTAIACNSFDQVNSITSYIITPLSLFSGNFFSLKNLPVTFQLISKINPMFYMVEGCKYSLGYTIDTNINTGMIIISVCNISLTIITYHLIKQGWGLKN